MTLKDYTENNGLLVQKDGDGGDSSHMTALASGLLLLCDDAANADNYFNALVNRCTPIKGIWIRHPDQSKWYSNINNLSRDSAHAIMWCLSVWSIHYGSNYAKEIIKDFWRRKIKRFGFHQNIHIGCDVPSNETGYKIPDITSPEEISQFFRAFNLWWTYPIISVLDLSLLINVIFGRKKWDSDFLLAKNIILANMKYKTVFGLIAKFVYKRTDYKNKISNYFFKTGNSIEPLAEIYNRVCTMYIGE